MQDEDKTGYLLNEAQMQTGHQNPLENGKTLYDFAKYYRVTTVAPTNAKKPKGVYYANVIVVDSLTAPTTAKLYMYAAAIKKWTYVNMTIV